MRLFLIYLKQQKKEIAVFLLFSAVFCISFLLYRLPLGAALYPSLLCALIGLIFFITDFSRVSKKHKKLAEICKLNAALITSLPDPDTIEESDYQMVIKSLKNEVKELEATSTAGYQDMIEYYTIWAHQIKTPIASMRLHLQNEDTLFSRKLSSDLFRVEQYVEMVLAFLRIDSISSDYVFKEHSIDSIVRQTVKKFASEFIDRKIRLEYEPINETVITDEKWLSFVLEQLFSNALKYTREGSIKIYLKAPKTLCVEDSGIGIAPEDLPRIFEKGYTGYNGRSDKKASGIGLYLCKRICGNLGAEITAESEVESGTVIRIHLEQYKLTKD